MITVEKIHEIVQERRQDITDCLSEVIQAPSEQTLERNNAKESVCSKVLAKWIEKFGLKPEMLGSSEDRLNVISEWKGSQEGPAFLFNGHIDTHARVPEDDGTYGPFSGKVADGYVYGVGASNMKSGNVAALFAVGLLKEMGFDPKGNITLSYCVDELNGGWMGSKWLIERGYLKADFGICMDVSDRKLNVEIGGLYRVAITYRSVPAPSHRKHPSTDALTKSLRAVNALLEMREKFIVPTPASEIVPNMSITTMHAGVASNSYADISTFTVDCRVVAPRNNKDVESEIRRILDGLKEKYDEMDYEYELISDRPPMVIPTDCEIVKVCKEVYKEQFGKEVELYRCTAGADAQSIFDAYGTHIPVFGPSWLDDIGLPDEKVRIDDVLSFVELYMRILVRMMA